jgi:hypothetical protein
LNDRIKELEEYRSLVGKLRARQIDIKKSSDKSDVELELDRMDIRNIYSSDKTDKEQELQAFIYELKKQLEVLLEENSKLSKKAINFTKLEKLEKLLKDKEFKLNNLENDNILYKDKLN